MKPRFDDPGAREDFRERLAGLGERSARKSYYPELQARLDELERFRALVDQSTEAILVVDVPDGHLVDANETACQQLGRPRAALLGAPAADLLEPPGDAALAARVAARGAGGGPALSARLRRADGTSFPAEIGVRVVEREGRAFAVVAARDVTERDALRARLALAERLVSVGTLAAGVAHEINNPLTYVIGNLEVVRRLLADARAQAGAPPAPPRALLEALEGAGAAVEDALGGADRVRRIVRDLKAFARPDVEAPATLDVHAVLESALGLVGHELRQRARIVKRLGQLPGVSGDEGRLAQVFVNLLVNAAHAMAAGGPERNVLTLATRAEAGEVVISVEDTGEGIAPAHLAHIFDPFFTTKPPGVGTGLGLSICHGIVAGMGGRIAVRSTPGAGSAFEVRLPAGRAPARAATAPEAARAGPSWRVLVVDDDPLCARAVARLLSGAHSVVARTSAAEALALLAHDGDFDAVLCDVVMPGEGGAELHAEVARRAPDLAERFVFVTGGAFTERARAFLARTRAPVLEKPFAPGPLLAALDEAARRGGRGGR